MPGDESVESTPTTTMGIGVYFLAGPVVVAIAGIGGHFGERLWGGPGYWIGCYVAAFVAAAVVSILFARIFHGHPLYWALGAIGMLIGGHMTWTMLSGNVGDAPASGSDRMLVGGAAITGMLLGFAVAHPVVVRRLTKSPAR